MDFSIRRAVEADYAGLNVLFEELDEHHRKALPRVFRKPDGPPRTQDFLSGVLADQSAVIFVAEARDRIIGLVYAYVRLLPESPIRIPCPVGEVDQIIVSRKYRRHGVGKALMECVNHWAGLMKLGRLELSVWNFNEEARDFYRKLEYETAFVRMWNNGPFPD